MPVFPDDIFTESTNVDPDTLANLGPLRRLAGGWEARKGVDLNPKAAGPERRVYMERIDFEPIDPQANGPQLFYGLRYHVHITTEQEDITFHDQVGYWLWEPATGLVMQTVAIPRGQVAIASGTAAPNADRLVLTAERGQTEYGICSTAFLEYAFRTDSILTVHGRTTPFTHRDQNTLVKVNEALPNPLARIIAAKRPTSTP